VKDNGRGIPVEIHPKTGKSTLETVLTNLHAGGKFGGGGYKVSFDLKGGDASALLGGTAVFLIIIINVINFGKDSLENVCENIID
ncbi:hypothetical protein ACTPD5_21740, partial [Clostridioides difficile]